LASLNWRKAALLAGLVWLALAGLLQLGLLSNIELSLENSLYGRGTPSGAIAIVAIDDSSLQAVGRWPWDRTVHAQLVDKLSQAKVVGVDVAFFEPSSSESDRALAQAISRAGNVILPIEYTSFEQQGDKLVGKGLLQPIPEIRSSAKGFGYINVVTDADGVSRSVNVGVGGSYDAFTHALFQAYTGTKYTFPQDRLLIDFVGPPGSFKYVSAKDVLSGAVPASFFKGKIVLVGATSPDLHDDHIVPTSEGKRMPGVELHANVVQQLLTGNFIYRQDSLSAALVMLVGAVLAVVLFLRLRLWAAAAALLALCVAYYFLSIVAFELVGILPNLLFPPLSALAAFGIVLGYSYLFESKQRKFVSDAFSKYVSPGVMAHILANPEKLKLGGEKTRITIFFSDVRGFTSLSEKLTPEKLVHLLNQYLTEMTRLVMTHDGTVDKFIGDAVMALWGVPLRDHRQASKACECSLRMMEKLKELNTKWKAAGSPEIEIGVGLNTGEAIVGNMGSFERFDYTAMGDSVNLASRLEGLNKEYKTHIIVSESTKTEAGNDFLFRELDLVAVKGKKEPVRIYELVGRRAEVKLKDVEWLEWFEKGLAHYRKQEWKTAMVCFNKSLKSGDVTSNVFLERCKYYEMMPPAKEWDGVNVMHTK